MSHTATVTTEVKNLQAIKDACERLGLEAPTQGNHKLFSSNHDGTAVKLKGWRYPVIFDKTGAANYDTYNGKWGNVADLDKFKQAYGVCVSTNAKAGKWKETPLANGSIQLTLVTQ